MFRLTSLKPVVRKQPQHHRDDLQKQLDKLEGKKGQPDKLGTASTTKSVQGTIACPTI
jgi:hypothetical protein